MSEEKNNASSTGDVGWSVNRLRRRPRKCTHDIDKGVMTVDKGPTERKRVNSLPKEVRQVNCPTIASTQRSIRNGMDIRFAAVKTRETIKNPRPHWENVAGVPHFPDVTFIPLPFQEILGQLVQPTTIFNDPSEDTCSFYLTPSQASLIQSGRKAADLLNQNDKYSVQVLVRIGLSEITSAQYDYYPPGLMIHVNRSQFPIPSITSSSSDPKKNLPIDITPFVFVDPFAANTVKITSHPTFQRYATAVYLVKKQSWNVLLSRLRSKALRVAYYTKAMIQQKLKNDAENDILTTSLRVSLECPLGKMRMGTPCRPTTCDHIQCFDASIFLQMNEKKATWQCPVCNKPAHYETLTIDEYFQDVVASSTLPSSCCEIEVMADGGWRPMNSIQQSTQQTTSTEANSSSVNLDSSDGEIEVIQCDRKEVPRKPTRRSRTPLPDVVDLVSSPSPPASPESPSKLLPFKKRRTHQTSTDTRNVTPMMVIDLDSSSDGDDDEVKACSSTSSSDSEVVQPPHQRKSRKRLLTDTSDSDGSYGSSYQKLLRDEQLISDDEIKLSQNNVVPSRINTISYSINKAKSSATSIVIQKAPNSSSAQTSQENTKTNAVTSAETLPDSSSKTNNDPLFSTIFPESCNSSEKNQIVESISNYLISAMNNRCELMGVLDQVAENLGNDERSSNYYNNIVDLNESLNLNNGSSENNDSSVICLDLTSNANSSDGNVINSENQELTPMQSLMLAISQVDSNENKEQSEAGPSTSKTNTDENTLKSVDLCNTVSSTGDVDDHNYVHRESETVERDDEIIVEECQGSIVTSTNNDQIQEETVDPLPIEVNNPESITRLSESNKENDSPPSEELATESPEIAIPSTVERYEIVPMCLEQLDSSSSLEQSSDNPTEELSPTENTKKPKSPRPNILKKK